MLKFAFLVHPRSRGGRPVWFARSVLTGHVAHGASPDEAVESLQEILDASIDCAARSGQSPAAWYRAQRPDADAYVLEFCRLVAEGAEPSRAAVVSRSGYSLEAQVHQAA